MSDSVAALKSSWLRTYNVLMIIVRESRRLASGVPPTRAAGSLSRHESIVKSGVGVRAQTAEKSRAVQGALDSETARLHWDDLGKSPTASGRRTPRREP